MLETGLLENFVDAADVEEKSLAGITNMVEHNIDEKLSERVAGQV